MSKLIAIALTASLFVVSTATAQAAGRGSCCTQAAASCTSAAPAAPAHDHANMTAPTAKAPQATRSYSYQPSQTYRAPRSMRSQGWNSGIRGADSKVLGNY
jgi:hypothetical protein